MRTRPFIYSNSAALWLILNWKFEILLFMLIFLMPPSQYVQWNSTPPRCLTRGITVHQQYWSGNSKVHCVIGSRWSQSLVWKCKIWRVLASETLIRRPGGLNGEELIWQMEWGGRRWCELLMHIAHLYRSFIPRPKARLCLLLPSFTANIQRKAHPLQWIRLIAKYFLSELKKKLLYNE